MIRRTIFTLALLSLGGAAVLAQSAGTLHQALTAESKRLQAFGTDPLIVGFVKDQNAKHISLAEIQRMDKQWIAGGAAATMKAVVTGPCADHLRKLFADPAKYSEVFLMDDQGALVCASGRTSDYWQGDEEKWTRSFNGGSGTVFIDRPRFDESSQSEMSSISVPVLDGRTTVGVLMIGVRVDKLTTPRK